MFSIYRKELKVYFTSLLGYVPMFIFLLIAGILFYAVCVVPQTADDFPSFFSILNNVLLFIIPILTLRVFVEDKKLSTYELLLTSPITPWEIILGKFLAVFTFVMLAVSIVLIYPLTLTFLTKVPWGMVLAGYLGIAFSVAFFVSLGMFASSLTDNYVVAGLISLGLSVIMLVIGMLGGASPVGPAKTVAAIFADVSYSNHYQQFATGFIRVKDIVYFAIGTFIWLNLSRMMVESRMAK